MEQEKMPIVTLETSLGCVKKTEIRRKLCGNSRKRMRRIIDVAKDSDTEFAALYKSKYELKNELPKSIVAKILSISGIDETVEIKYFNKNRHSVSSSLKSETE